MRHTTAHATFSFTKDCGLIGSRQSKLLCDLCITALPNLFDISDDHGEDDSMTVLAELEKIDDDCDKHGIQFVKIDDDAAAKNFGIDSVPAIVYFEKQIPNVYDGEIYFFTFKLETFRTFEINSLV